MTEYIKIVSGVLLAVVLAIILATSLWVSRAVIPTGIGEEDEE